MPNNFLSRQRSPVHRAHKIVELIQAIQPNNANQTFVEKMMMMIEFQM